MKFAFPETLRDIHCLECLDHLVQHVEIKETARQHFDLSFISSF